MSRFVWVVCVLASASLANSALAQAPTPPAPNLPATAPKVPVPVPPQTAPPSASTTKPPLAGKPVAAVGQPNCTRLPLSDIQFTEEKTIEVARMRLGEYAQKVATQRGWKGFRKSDETVSCEVYLWLGPLGTEYKCLVTATFCPGPGVTSAAKPAPSIKPASGTTPSTTPPIAAPKPAPAVSAVPSAAAVKSTP